MKKRKVKTKRTHRYDLKRVAMLSAAVLAAAIFVLVSNIAASTKEYPATVSFLSDGDFLPALVKDIAEAENTVYCSLYMFKTDGTDIDSTHLILKSMLYVLDNGVKVRVVLDIGGENDLTTEFNTHTGKVLERAGATVVYDSPDRRLHSKMCVIDGEISYIGSHNYTYSALKRNAEVTVRIKSKDIASDAIEYMKGLGLE